MKLPLILLASFTATVIAVDCTFLPDYQIIDGDKTFDLPLYGAIFGRQKFDQDLGNLLYNEEAAGIFFNQYFNQKNVLTCGLGYTRQQLKWKQNPAFKQQVFDDFVLDISFTTFQADSWRWIIDLGAHVNLNHFNLINSAFYTQLLWGRYQHLDNLGFHIGFAGQAGCGKADYLPLLGLDWYFHPQFSIIIVYPAEAALNYHINNEWKISAKYRSFAGWYHAYHRTGQDETLPESIFTMESQGVDLGVYLDKSHLRFYLFGGYNLGGWILIEDSDGNHGHYYHFDYAPYVAGKLGLTF